jgi:hypothetical protein
MRKTNWGICVIGDGVKDLACPIFDRIDNRDFICQANKTNPELCKECKDNQHRQRGTIVKVNITITDIVKVS